MRELVIFLCLTCVAMSVFGLGGQEEQISEPTVEKPSGVLVLADISDEPIKKIKRFQPLADYLADNLNDYGIGHGEVLIAPDMETMAGYLRTGKADLYFDSPFPAMIVCDDSGAVPLLRRWKGGVAEYHSIFFAYDDSGIDAIDDLKGKLIAYDEPFSTSGYMLPTAHLVLNGLKTKHVAASASIDSDIVGYEFAGEDENVVSWVIDRKADAGVLDVEGFEELPEETRSRLKILGVTETVPRQIAVVRSDLDAAIVSEITSLLENMHNTEAGREVLTIFKTEKFDKFPGGAETAFNRMRELYEATE